MEKRYVKKAVVISAIQFVGDNAEVLQAIKDFMCCDTLQVSYAEPHSPQVVIATLEGEMKANVGDFIIKGIKGEFYPCKPDIFEATYLECENQKNSDLSFGQAIEALKQGDKVCRAGWNGKGMFLFFANGADTANCLFGDGTKVDNYIVMKTAGGSLQPGWLASQADMLSEDWMILE